MTRQKQANSASVFITTTNSLTKEWILSEEEDIFIVSANVNPY